MPMAYYPGANIDATEVKTMTGDQFLDGIHRMADETGIPFEQLMNLTHSELQPIFEFARIKVEMRIASKQAKMERLRAEEKAWLDAHPLWREHVMRKTPADAP
jgi:hypothetical protein